jgi:hypothetical protein
MNSLVDYLNCGISRDVVKRPAFDFVVNKFVDIEEKIIPFLLNRPLQGIKSRDFEDFCLVAHMIKNKNHLTLDGLKEIQKIKSGMNIGRNMDIKD